MGRTWPHCDSMVLHAPGMCSVCDEHGSDLQEVRIAWGINFTGEYEPGKYLCPAEHRRGLHIINRWYGNVPDAPAVPTIPDPQEVEEARVSLQRLLGRTPDPE